MRRCKKCNGSGKLTRPIDDKILKDVGIEFVDNVLMEMYDCPVCRGTGYIER